MPYDRCLRDRSDEPPSQAEQVAEWLGIYRDFDFSGFETHGGNPHDGFAIEGWHEYRNQLAQIFPASDWTAWAIDGLNKRRPLELPDTPTPIVETESTIMDKLQVYAQNQVQAYADITQTVDGARAAVGPNYDHLAHQAKRMGQIILSQYFFRKGLFAWSSAQAADLKVLDFGCGVGRVMDAFVDLGVSTVDGADLSEKMIGFAKADSKLSRSKFFLTNGTNLGDAPLGHYDVIYSLLCLHHIPMRQTRISILQHMAKSLRDDGIVFLEFKIYPGANPRRIPHNHAHWSENVVAKGTNSASDVWITPDALGLVYEDLRLCFEEVSMFEIEAPNGNFHQYTPDAIYQYPFNQVFFSASKKGSLFSVLAG